MLDNPGTSFYRIKKVFIVEGQNSGNAPILICQLRRKDKIIKKTDLTLAILLYGKVPED